MAPQQPQDHDDDGGSAPAASPSGGRHPRAAAPSAAEDAARRPGGSRRRAAFLRSFCRTAGAPQIIALCLALALALGATVGVVPVRSARTTRSSAELAFALVERSSRTATTNPN